jgi:hypothetical protein
MPPLCASAGIAALRTRSEGFARSRQLPAPSFGPRLKPRARSNRAFAAFDRYHAGRGDRRVSLSTHVDPRDPQLQEPAPIPNRSPRNGIAGPRQALLPAVVLSQGSKQTQTRLVIRASRALAPRDPHLVCKSTEGGTEEPTSPSTPAGIGERARRPGAGRGQGDAEEPAQGPKDQFLAAQSIQEGDAPSIAATWKARSRPTRGRSSSTARTRPRDSSTRSVPVGPAYLKAPDDPGDVDFEIVRRCKRASPRRTRTRPATPRCAGRSRQGDREVPPGE